MIEFSLAVLALGLAFMAVLAILLATLAILLTFFLRRGRVEQPVPCPPESSLLPLLHSQGEQQRPFIRSPPKPQLTARNPKTDRKKSPRRRPWKEGRPERRFFIIGEWRAEQEPKRTYYRLTKKGEKLLPASSFGTQVRESFIKFVATLKAWIKK